MGFVTGNAQQRRWPGAIIPYEIDEATFPRGPVGGAARAIIDSAINTWNMQTVVQVRPRQGEADYLVFEPNAVRCFSGVGRIGGRQSIGCALPVEQIAQPGGDIAFGRQGNDQLTALAFDITGALCVFWSAGRESWQGPVRVSPPNTAPPGAPIATAQQGDDQLTALFIDNSGALSVMWVAGGGAWQGPVRIGPQGMSRPGAPIALAEQTPGRLAALYADADRGLHVSWVEGGGAWQGPVRLALEAIPSDGGIAFVRQGPDQLTAAFFDLNGAMNVIWSVGNDPWQGPVKVTPDGTAVPGARLDLIEQVPGQVTAAFLDPQGALSVAWVIGGGVWQGPVKISADGTVPAGTNADVALGHQGDNQTVALFHDAAGGLAVSWVDGAGVWQGPAQIGMSAGTGVAGGGVAVARQDDDLLVAMRSTLAGTYAVAWAPGLNPWQGPAAFRSGTFNATSILHELGHAAGLLHEHQRPDRNTFVTFNPANLVRGTSTDDFDIIQDGQPVGAYNCQALMHYSRSAFANLGTNSLTPVPAAACAGGIGGATGLTPGDIDALAFLYGRAAPAGATLALARQVDDQHAAVWIDTFGALAVSWVRGGEAWAGPAQISPPNLAPPGGGIAAARQPPFDDQMVALYVDNAGFLTVSWVEGGGAWQGPVRISAAPVAPAGAKIAMALQGDNQLSALFFDNDGALNVAWSTNGGPWQGPQKISPDDTAPAGAAIALVHQGADQLNALYFNQSGALTVSWVPGGGVWQGPVEISPRETAKPGGRLAAHVQVADQITVAYVNRQGALAVSWVVGGGIWQGPAEVSPQDLLPRDSDTGIALIKQTDSLLVAAYYDRDGAFTISWVDGPGIWQGPARIGPVGQAPAGAAVAAFRQTDRQITVLAVANNGAAVAAWAVELDPWNGPVAIY